MGTTGRRPAGPSAEGRDPGAARPPVGCGEREHRGSRVGQQSRQRLADGTLPDGSTVPDEAIEAPASLSTRAQLAPGMKGDPDDAVGNAAPNGIPWAALTAYQRAETVINAADTTCHLPWQLVAAIGRVESDHGRVHGSHLDDQGLARPAIYGIPLDGSRGTARIDDTDAGLLDGDAEFDRAVGPMQFIPSTWSVVGVDADGDAQRDPQDVDDASLATAVYLCSGDDDLATDAGRRSSVFRYNHSQEYVDLVLAFFDAYVAGDYTAVPNGSGGGDVILPSGGPGSGGGGGGGGGGGNGTPTAEPEPDPTDGGRRASPRRGRRPSRPRSRRASRRASRRSSPPPRSRPRRPSSRRRPPPRPGSRRCCPRCRRSCRPTCPPAS